MTQVEEYLAQSGEMERLSQHLHDRLEQSGWFDQVSTMAAAELSASDNPNFDSITQQVTARAMGIVSEDIKVEMLQLIRSIIDQVVEKA